jgi:hypothetical protein
VLEVGSREAYLLLCTEGKPASIGACLMRLPHLIAALAFAAPALLAAQQVRGTVRESAAGQPIPGAVVFAYGDAQAVVGRALTDDQGRYRVVLSGTVRSIRVMRIGFRPSDVPVAEGVQDIDVRLTIIPTLLERVQVVADPSLCPRRNDRAQTASLLDQARAALIATVIAREADPATVKRIRFERLLDLNGERIVQQTVRLETADRATVSFNASHTAAELVERGFSAIEDSRREFFGPDADVLLDDSFGRAYCFRIADRDPSRPALMGIGFTPAARKGGRVDIDGALWVDTVARRLSHVEFKYLGLDELSEGLGAGGTVSFREVAPSIVLIDRWALRVVGGREKVLGAPQTSQQYAISEIGGELATASWPGGRNWSAPLGTLRMRGNTSAGAPNANVNVTLLGTEYVATTDSLGQAEFTHLVPGPYRLAVLDPKLASIGLDIPTELAFTAARDSVHQAMVILPSAMEFAANVCRGGGRVAEESAWLIGRVGTSNGAPVSDAKWSVARSSAAGWVPIAEGGSAGAGGIFSHCRNLKLGETVQVRAWQGKNSPAVSVRVLSDRLTVLPVKLPTAVARGRGAVGTLRGEVRDSAANAVIAGAFVELSGTNLTAITDSLGAFSINGVAPGEYTAEIRSDHLDSLGAVGRSTFSFASASTPVRLFVPTAAELLTAICGPAAVPGTGALVGSFVAPEGEKYPPNLRVVAEWNEEGTEGAGPGARFTWARARVDSGGRFRLCGIPRRGVFVVRSQTDSGATVASKPQAMSFASGRALVLADVPLEKGLVVGAAYSGLVIADSTEEAVAGAEVVFNELNRTAVTGTNGTFRFNDIPAGKHRVTIRRGGFRPINAEVSFAENQTVDHRIVLGQAVAALPQVSITEDAPSVNSDFDNHRKLGIGRFLTRAELDKLPGRALGMAIATTPTMGVAPQSNGNHAWLIGKRMPVRMAPNKPPLPANFNDNKGFGEDAERARGEAIQATADCGRRLANSMNDPCNFSPDDLREVGFYCPQGGDAAQGIRCACYAQVYLDGSLMNKQRPTEPFDINSINADDVEGVEWYSSAAQTPARYSSLNAACGVMAIWTRKSRPHFF